MLYLIAPTSVTEQPYVPATFVAVDGVSHPTFGHHTAAVMLSHTRHVANRWRASKGSVPVTRFTRAFGNHATEGWHRSMPVTQQTAGSLFLQALAASLSPEAVLATQNARVALGALSFAGALARSGFRVPSGALTPAGAFVRRANKTLAGALTPAGAKVRRLARALSGALTSAATLVALGLRARSLTGALTSAGAAAGVRFLERVTSGSLSPIAGLTTILSIAQYVVMRFAPTRNRRYRRYGDDS